MLLQGRKSASVLRKKESFVIPQFEPDTGGSFMAEAKENVFPTRVRELMRAHRYSQKKLCELCGITEAAFSRYMTSDRLPKTEILANIANILHTTSDYLIGNDSQYGYDQLKILLAATKDDLSKNQRSDLIKILTDW